MATTRVTTTRDGASAIDYASQQGKPHDSSNPNVTQRVLRLNAYNCSVNKYKDQMQAVWSANHTKRNNRIELYRITQSFGQDELDIDDVDNLEKNLDLANKAGMNLAKKLYPNRQFIVSTQADGKGHMIHNHIDVVNPDMYDGKALRGKKTRQGYIAQISDEICKNLGIHMSKNLNPVKQGSLRTKSAKTINKNKQSRSKSGRSSFIRQIQDVVSNVSKDSSVYTTDQFQDKCKSLGVDVRFRKRKSGTITGVSYKLDDSEMKRAVRGNRLGSDFQVDYLVRLLKEREESLPKKVQNQQKSVIDNPSKSKKKPKKAIVKPKKAPIKKSARKKPNKKIIDDLDILLDENAKTAKKGQNLPKKDIKTNNHKFNSLVNDLDIDIDLQSFLNNVQVKEHLSDNDKKQSR